MLHSRYDVGEPNERIGVEAYVRVHPNGDHRRSAIVLAHGRFRPQLAGTPEIGHLE